MSYDPIPSYELTRLLIAAAHSLIKGFSPLESIFCEDGEKSGVLKLVKNDENYVFYVLFKANGEADGEDFVERFDGEAEARRRFEQERKNWSITHK